MNPFSMPTASLQHLGDRRQAIGGAGGVGDDHVVLGQLVVVDAVDDGEVGAVGRRRDQHALGAGGEMRRGLVLGGEDAGAFHARCRCRGLSRAACVGSLIAVTLIGAVADADGVALDGDFAGKPAMHRVEAQQMRVGLDWPEIVDADHLDVVAARFGNGTQNIAADAAEPVDGNADGHCSRSRLCRHVMADTGHGTY